MHKLILLRNINKLILILRLAKHLESYLIVFYYPKKQGIIVYKFTKILFIHTN